MSTAAQIAANRANAQKSTGPRTPEGKEASRFNALKHGADAASVVIPGEDPADYERVFDDYHRQFNPTTALEQFQVDTIIRAHWQRARLKRIENAAYRALLAEGATPEEIDLDAYAGSSAAKLLRRVVGQINSLERSHRQAVKELRRIAREREQSEERAGEAAAGAGLALKLASIPEIGHPQPISRSSNLPNPVPPTPAARDLNPALRL